ncbi:MAG: hypothetical protein LAN62_13375, partial [Acidobacteriia bacterium]|nr:hypothetical protein [Terriglobia bacterium]
IPYDIFGNRDNQHAGLSDRAELIASPAIPAGAPRTQTGPPVSAFGLAAYDTAPNLGRNSFFGPGANNWNISLLKDQSLTEKLKLQLRFEFYNLFNRVWFIQPADPNSHGANFIQNSGIFGQSSATVTQPDGTTSARQIQFGMKLIF